MNYQFKNKYILTATFRKDGSSRFAEQERWGVFPSAALAWKIGDENFLDKAENLSNLKLGYGTTGQQDGIGNYGYVSGYQLSNIRAQYPFGTTWNTSMYPKPFDAGRKWEQTTTSNIGVDWGFYNDRLTGSIDLYKKETTDLMNDIFIPLGTNFASNMVKNIGAMENKGIEIAVNAMPVQTDNFDWSFGLNFTYNENEITALTLDDTNPDSLSSGDVVVNEVGYTRNSFFLYHQLYDADGMPIEDAMLDVNSDGAINVDDKYVSKSALLKYMLGFNTTLIYKKLSVNMAFHANLGHYLMYVPNDNSASIYGSPKTPRNLNSMHFDNQFKSGGNFYQWGSDHYLQNASFLLTRPIYNDIMRHIVYPYAESI